MQVKNIKKHIQNINKNNTVLYNSLLNVQVENITKQKWRFLCKKIKQNGFHIKDSWVPVSINISISYAILIRVLPLP